MLKIKNVETKIFSNYFKILNQLQELIFSCYIKRDYFEKRYQYEENIQQIRKQLFEVMKKLRLLFGGETKKISQFENLYEIIFSLGTLKLRVPDQATFEVCENEMKILSNCLAKILLGFSLHKNSLPQLIDAFAGAVNGFEELYQSTLQVVSYEPIVFLFFVQDLIALREEFQFFATEFGAC